MWWEDMKAGRVEIEMSGMANSGLNTRYSLDNEGGEKTIWIESGSNPSYIMYWCKKNGFFVLGSYSEQNYQDYNADPQKHDGCFGFAHTTGVHADDPVLADWKQYVGSAWKQNDNAEVECSGKRVDYLPIVARFLLGVVASFGS